MDAPVYNGGLELRAAGDGTRRLTGSFPYLSLAIVNSGGNGRRPQKERFASRAFAYAIEDKERDIHLLSGHSFDKPLASKKAGTLILRDTDTALGFEAVLTPDIQRTSWAADFMAAFAAGLIGGISPGFRVAPPEAVPKPEEVTEEDPSEGNALIRTIFAAVLFELSMVTRPAYPETQADLRSFDSNRTDSVRLIHPYRRWRA